MESGNLGRQLTFEVPTVGRGRRGIAGVRRCGVVHYEGDEHEEQRGARLTAPPLAGALDPRFRRVWLVHSGGDNRAWIANRLESRIANAPMRHAAASLLHLLAYGASFRTEKWAPLIAPRAVVVVGAARDEQMPRKNVERLFAAAREPKELLWSEGGHVRPDRATSSGSCSPWRGNASSCHES